MPNNLRIIDKVAESGFVGTILGGELSCEVLTNLVAMVEELEEAYPTGFARFTDLSSIEAINISFTEVQTIAERRRSFYSGPAVRSSILAVNPLMFGIARMYATMVYPAPIEVSVFYDLKIAAEWITIDADVIAAALRP